VVATGRRDGTYWRNACSWWGLWTAAMFPPGPNDRWGDLTPARKTELPRAAARLFAEKGYHGTSIGDLAEAMGVQKGSVYAHIESKQDLLYETLRGGAAAFHGALDLIPETLPAVDKLRLALRAHLAIVAEQLDVATVWMREWRYLEGERREEVVAARRRSDER